MFFIKIYIKESYINDYHTIIQTCGQYCILAPIHLRAVMLCMLKMSKMGKEHTHTFKALKSV